jgi:hypothetical protein
VLCMVWIKSNTSAWIGQVSLRTLHNRRLYARKDGW